MILFYPVLWGISFVPKSYAKKVWTYILQTTLRDSYVETELFWTEHLGYHAAGFFIVNEDNKVLVVQEKRGDESILNLPGGKREVNEFDPFTTAKRELAEETGIILKHDNYWYWNVQWLATGKYALFHLYISESDFDEIPWTSEKTEQVLWISQEDFKSSLHKGWPLCKFREI